MEYLSVAHSCPSFPVTGLIYGMNMRLMVNLICRRAPGSLTVSVIFLVDTGSPKTFLSECATEKIIGASVSNIVDNIYVLIHGNRTIKCGLSPHDRHFADVNVLGMDFLASNNLSLALDHPAKSFKMLAL